ncbi:GNAT family N-acetyltransferase [Chromobacterium haemolyticum]|nr:GNAT family N-acetyltransferase [Chromobacterium haemolyticum]
MALTDDCWQIVSIVMILQTAWEAEMQAVDTGRMILRPFKEDDLDAFYRLGTVAEAIRYVGNTPLARPSKLCRQCATAR